MCHAAFCLDHLGEWWRDVGDKPITHKHHFYLFLSSNRKLSHTAVMQKLGSLRAAGGGSGPMLALLCWVLLCFQGCGVRWTWIHGPLLGCQSYDPKNPPFFL